MYMSYCRHEGSLAELRACLSDATEHVNEEAEYEVSDREINCFRTMVKEFVSWLQDAEILDDEGEIDDDALEQVCEAMSKAYPAEEDEDYE